MNVLRTSQIPQTGAPKQAPAQQEAPPAEQDNQNSEPSDGFSYSGTRQVAIMGASVIGSLLVQNGNPYAKAVGFGIGAITAASGALQVAKGENWRVKLNGGLQAFTGVATMASGPLGAGIVGTLSASALALGGGHVLNQPGGTVKAIGGEYGKMVGELGGESYKSAKSAIFGGGDNA